MSKRWEFRKDGFVYDVETNERVCSPHSTLPDSIKKFGPHKQDLIANARLIAAAPDLLEALQDLCDTLGECGMTEKARAAIAKAEGGAGMTTSTHPADTSKDGGRIDTTRAAMQQALRLIEDEGHKADLLEAASILRAALAEQKCSCGDRPADHCPGEWEPGCDLGANEKHAKVATADASLGAAIEAIDAALAEQAQPVAWAEQIIDDLHALHDTELIREIDSGDALIRLDAAIAAVEEARDRYTTPPAPVVPPGWRPISEPYEPADELDIMLSDGSILCAVLPQFDGDLWWAGDGTGEKFIDPKYANVTHWRLHAAAPEAPTPPAPQPLTELPPLPESEYWLAFYDEGGMQEASGKGYAADQMRAYARAVEAEVLKRMGAQR